MKVLIIVSALLAVALAAPGSMYRASLESGRMVGGKPVPEGQNFFIVTLEYIILGINNKHTCGGTIITPKCVLTAGHCQTELPSSGSYLAVAGCTNLNVRTNAQTVRVAKREVHKDYKGGVGPHDIALFTLETPFILGEFVNVISLPPHDAETGFGKIILTGWGNDESGKTPSNLLEMEKELISLDECDAELTALITTHSLDKSANSSNICTAGKQDTKHSACQGDSGGPLYRIENNRPVQWGIVSWGISPCGYPRAPSVYVRLSKFVNWIKERI